MRSVQTAFRLCVLLASATLVGCGEKVSQVSTTRNEQLVAQKETTSADQTAQQASGQKVEVLQGGKAAEGAKSETLSPVSSAVGQVLAPPLGAGRTPVPSTQPASVVAPVVTGSSSPSAQSISANPTPSPTHQPIATTPSPSNPSSSPQVPSTTNYDILYHKEEPPLVVSFKNSPFQTHHIVSTTSLGKISFSPDSTIDWYGPQPEYRQLANGLQELGTYPDIGEEKITIQFDATYTAVTNFTFTFYSFVGSFRVSAFDSSGVLVASNRYNASDTGVNNVDMITSRAIATMHIVPVGSNIVGQKSSVQLKNIFYSPIPSILRTSSGFRQMLGTSYDMTAGGGETNFIKCPPMTQARSLLGLPQTFSVYQTLWHKTPQECSTEKQPNGTTRSSCRITATGVEGKFVMYIFFDQGAGFNLEPLGASQTVGSRSQALVNLTPYTPGSLMSAGVDMNRCNAFFQAVRDLN